MALGHSNLFGKREIKRGKPGSLVRRSRHWVAYKKLDEKEEFQKGTKKRGKVRTSGEK